MLTGSTAENVQRCQGKINKPLSRCTSSVKLIDVNGIFHFWDQHTINSFYKYCNDKCILLKFDETKTEIELIGFIGSIHEAKKRLQVLSELMKEKL